MGYVTDKTPKPWYKSSTIWLNIIGAVVIFLQYVVVNRIIIDPDILALIMAILNIFNRLRTTLPIQ